MDFTEKKLILDKIYSIHDAFFYSLDLACKKGCTDCCTRNVALTSLEAVKIIHHLNSNGKTALLEKFAQETNKKRFIPKVTINELAHICMRGEEPPFEENDPLWGRCLFLNQEECSVYNFRPFACRSMGSSVSCSKNGYAELNSFVITVNEVFMQYIEHIDQDGITGNLIDMLLFFSIRENREAYKNKHLIQTPKGFLRNMTIPALMIPPEHREKIKPILTALSSCDQHS